MLQENNKHIPILDSLRAIAALSVCFYHFVCGPINFITNDTVLQVFTFGKYGVQLFFVISGFVIPWSITTYDYKIKKYFHFILKRFLRLEPPYILSIVMVVVLFSLRKYYTDVPDARMLNANQILLHLGYLIPFSNYDWLIDVYWTLAIEFQFYLFMGLFYFVIISPKIMLRICGYAFILAVSFIGTKEFLPYWLPIFLLGNVLFLYLTKRIEKIEFSIVLISIFVYICFFYPVPIFFSSLFPTLALLFLFNYYNKILTWLGKISYSIYLIHTIVGTAVINVLSHFAHNTIAKIVVVLIGVGVSVLSAYIMYRVIEQPSKKLSSKIKLV